MESNEQLNILAEVVRVAEMLAAKRPSPGSRRREIVHVARKSGGKTWIVRKIGKRDDGGRAITDGQ